MTTQIQSERPADAAAAANFGPADRRRRRRRPTRVPGWIYAAGRVAEVAMRNLSPEGAGFVADAAFACGEPLHLRIGLGPDRRPRPARVVYARRRPDGRFEVGVRFVAAAIDPATVAA